MVWSLVLANGDGTLSGLQTTEGKNIYLFQQGGLIVGRYEPGNDPNPAERATIAAALALHIAADGTISVVQYVALSRQSERSGRFEHLPAERDLGQGDMDFDGDVATATISRTECRSTTTTRMSRVGTRLRRSMRTIQQPRPQRYQQ